jgi:dynein assembly factor with WDR repeat domains 1
MGFPSIFIICVQVLDIAFDYKGQRLATASSDATACIWDVHSDFKLLAKMEGHREEVSKVSHH